MKWIIITLVEAKSVNAALKQKGDIITVQKVVPSNESLSPLVGVDVSVPDEIDEEYIDEIGFKK